MCDGGEGKHLPISKIIACETFVKTARGGWSRKREPLGTKSLGNELSEPSLGKPARNIGGGKKAIGTRKRESDFSDSFSLPVLICLIKENNNTKKKKKKKKKKTKKPQKKKNKEHAKGGQLAGVHSSYSGVVDGKRGSQKEPVAIALAPPI